MKITVTIERLKPGKKSMPARWVTHAQGTFSSNEEVGRWMEKQGGVPREPSPGWGMSFRVT